MGFFSVNIFNRRKLLVDSSAEYIARCVDRLNTAGIPNEMHTKRRRTHCPNIMCNRNFVDYGISQQTMNPVDNLYTYTVRVPRKELERAKQLLGI